VHWLLFLAPIGFHLLLLPFWYFEKRPGAVSTLEVVAGTLIVPIYLIIVSVKIVNKISLMRWITTWLLMLIINTAGIAICYFNWGVTIGNLFRPDSETLHLVELQMIISSIMITILWAVICVIKSRSSANVR